MSNEPAASFAAVRMATHHGVGLSCRSGCSTARHAWRSARRLLPATGRGIAEQLERGAMDVAVAHIGNRLRISR
jgi:hypothetical protein